MRFKKIVSGLLASALVVTSVFTGNVTTAKAEVSEDTARAAAEEVVTPAEAMYSFDFNDETLPENLSVVGAGNSASSETPVFESGKSGKDGDKSIKLGDYALSMPANIGENYTVSVWVKPNVDKIETNHAIFLLGAANPEEWTGFAGQNAAGKAKLWSFSAEQGYTHTDIVSNLNMEKGKWTMLTLAQEGTKLSVYQDGVLKGTKDNASKVLTGENMRLLLGTTYWGADGTFDGWIDDVQIFDEKLDARQIFKLFEPRTEQEIFVDGEIQVSSKYSILLGGEATRKIKVDLPAGVSEDKVTCSFTSADPAIASVDANGVVTGKTVGETTITTTVVYDGQQDTAKTGTTVITVRDPEVKEEGVVVDYDLSQAVDGKLVDITGNGHDATLHGNKITFENGAMNLQGSKADNAYVDLPMSIINGEKGLTDPEKFTIQVKFAKSADVTNAWLYCFGSNPKASGSNYLFLSPNFENTKIRAGIKDDTNEKLFNTSMIPEKNKTYTVNMVFDHGVVKLYWNGVLIKGTDGADQIDSGYSIMDDVVTPGCKNNILGYIGKSCWEPDEYYKGLVSEFKIYDKAMTDEDVQLSDEAYQREFEAEIKKSLTVDKILGKNKNKDNIKYNLELPATIDGVNVTWASDKEEVINREGIVKCGAQDQSVKVTGTAKSGALTAAVEFELTVKNLERGALDAILEKANAVAGAADFKFYTAESQQNLTQLIAKAAEVANQEETDALAGNIKNAIFRLTYKDGYKDPFAKIDASKIVKNVELTPNTAADIFANAVPADVREFVIIDSVSNKPEIASVDKTTGKVTGVKVGYAMITTKVKAISDGFEMEYQTLVKVDLDLKPVTVQASAAALAKGGKAKISINYPAAVQAAGPVVSYSAKGAVSVDKNGQVTGKSAGTGTVIVKVKAGGKTITKRVSVKVGDITGASKVKIKKSISLKVTGISGKAKWSLDKKGKKLATISKTGKLKAKNKAGKVTVTAKVGKITMKKKITITKK